jgi:hypothetical protein
MAQTAVGGFGHCETVEFFCADCGCLAECGEIVAPCGKHPECCCRELPTREPEEA